MSTDSWETEYQAARSTDARARQGYLMSRGGEQGASQYLPTKTLNLLFHPLWSFTADPTQFTIACPISASALDNLKRHEVG